MYGCYRKHILVALALLIRIILALFITIMIIFRHKARDIDVINNNNKIEVPRSMTVPDNKYIDHKFQEIFSSSFYLPEIDICSPEPNGVKT